MDERDGFQFIFITSRKLETSWQEITSSPVTAHWARSSANNFLTFHQISPDDDADNRELHLAPSTVTILFFTEITLFCTGIKDLVRKSLVEYSVQVQIQN